jgi:hypothetical protein
MKRKIRFSGGYWYSLCRPCLDSVLPRFKNAGWCKADPGDRFGCALCKSKATVEFYPRLRK